MVLVNRNCLLTQYSFLTFLQPMPLFFLLCLLCLRFLANGQFMTSSCLYLQHVTLQDATNMTSGSSFNFPITWTSPQTDRGAGGLVLGGFYTQNNYCYPSFSASLVNQTSTGAAIVFTNQETSTEVVFMQFDIVFGKASCSSHLEVVTQTFSPTILNTVPRSTSDQDFLLTHSSIPASTTLEFYVYFQAFVISSINSVQQLHFLIKTTSNQNNGSFIVRVESPSASQNQITSISFTAIVLQQSGFSTPIFADDLSYDSYGTDRVRTQTHSFSGAALNPSTVPSEQCVLGLYDIEGYGGTHFITPKALFRSFSGFNVEYTSKEMWTGRNRITCILECDPAYQLDTVTTSPYTCYLCKDHVSGCQICTDQTTCNVTCDSTVTGCTECDYQGNCLTCSGVASYRTDFCLCSQHPGCDSCFAESTCQTCASGYKSIDDYCVNCSSTIANCADCSSVSACTNCSTGFFVNGSGICQACSLSNCDDCLSATNCSVCASGYVLNGTFECQPCASAIPDCLTCASATECSVCAATHILNNANTTCDACSLAHCDTCATVLACSVCQSGYYLDSGSCLVDTTTTTSSEEGGGFPLIIVIGAGGGAFLLILVIIIVCCVRSSSKSQVASVDQPSMSQEKILSPHKATGRERITVGGKSYQVESSEIIAF